MLPTPFLTTTLISLRSRLPPFRSVSLVFFHFDLSTWLHLIVTPTGARYHVNSIRRRHKVIAYVDQIPSLVHAKASSRLPGISESVAQTPSSDVDEARRGLSKNAAFVAGPTNMCYWSTVAS